MPQFSPLPLADVVELCYYDRSFFRKSREMKVLVLLEPVRDQGFGTFLNNENVIAVREVGRSTSPFCKA